ncbi:MAG: hypothetical protein K5865_05955, partial [Eubacterium sp.]|nr:hypothetical protein [Eubacterium sp.]
KNAADCTHAAVYYKSCKCGAKGTETFEHGNALGHDMTEHEAKEVTCETDGNSAYWNCSRCKKFFSDAEGKTEIEENSWIIPATGHDYGTLIAEVPATCTDDGMKAHYECSVCHKLFVKDGDDYIEKTAEDLKIEAKGHKEETLPAVDPSCTVEGLSEGKRCSVCGEILVPQTKTSPALGHRWDVVKSTDATCQKEGYKLSKCSVCGEEQETVIPKKAHTPVIDPAVDPTTTSEGRTAGKHCSVCGEILIRQQVIPKLTPEKQHQKYSNEWVDGKWYDENGNQSYSGNLMWANDSTGWWVEDTSGWYPTDSWQKIDGVWYYFKPDGYMAMGEYFNGYWFNKDGSWDETYLLSWKSNSTGWWVEDISGWWPSNTWLKIDNYWYYFNSSGYMVTSQYVDGYWISSDGVCY